MANNKIQMAWKALTGNNQGNNAFNEAFLQLIGGGYARYDYNNKTYLERGYNENPTVFSIINKQTVKTVSVPYCIKEIESEKSYFKLKQLDLATKGTLSLMQQIKRNSLSTKAYKSEEKDFPLMQPNPNQTWSDVIGLYKTYMKITGNYYQYHLSAKDGMNKGVPKMVYVLPSHLMQIVLKPNANMLFDENPIDYYMLVDGNTYIKFMADEVLHVKYVNPNYDTQGSQLYGQSPLRSGLRNINSQNSAIDTNIKMLQSAGAYGFLYGKGTPLTSDQANSLKERLVEMDKDPERLGKIGASSAEVGFQRISLTTDELKPFDYLNWDQKTICNVLNFPDELLNADTSGAMAGSTNIDARKQLITDDIQPDLVLLQSAWNKSFIPLFKGYEKSIIEWDISELPEMQTDMRAMAEALNLLPLKPNEIREAFKYESLDDDGMDVVWINSGKQRIDDVSPGVIDNANL
jgi:HK97 family phage portal protein